MAEAGLEAKLAIALGSVLVSPTSLWVLYRWQLLNYIRTQTPTPPPPTPQSDESQFNLANSEQLHNPPTIGHQKGKESTTQVVTLDQDRMQMVSSGTNKVMGI